MKKDIMAIIPFLTRNNFLKTINKGDMNVVFIKQIKIEFLKNDLKSTAKI